MSALLTLTVVYLPRFEALATTTQSTADSLHNEQCEKQPEEYGTRTMFLEAGVDLEISFQV